MKYILHPNPHFDRTVLRSRLNKEAAMRINIDYTMALAGKDYEFRVKKDPLDIFEQVLESMGEFKKKS